MYYTTPAQHQANRKQYRNDPATVRNLGKTKRMMLINERKEAIETLFMNISFKANRSEEQREQRRNKR